MNPRINQEMVEVSKAELQQLRRDAEYGKQARKREAAIAEFRRHNRDGNGRRERQEVQGLGQQIERNFRALATEQGWTVSKRGWPDFILRKGDRVAFVEVKAHAEKSLKTEQREVAEMLARAGFKVFKWSPEGGFEQIDPS